MSDGESNFAEFEAQVASGNAAPAPSEAATAPKAHADDAGQPEAGKGAENASEPLELTEADEAVDVAEDEEGGEEHEQDGKKRRSKPAHQRIAELTAKLREAERERDALKAPAKPAEEASAPEKPKPEDFEYGEADPKYIDALTDWKIETREAERAKVETAKAEQKALFDKIEQGVAQAEEAAKAKYEDFDAKLAEAIEARGGEALPPLLTIGIGVSPVGGDLLYRLATDEAASERLEKLAKGGKATVNAMAMAIGELEGEYIEGSDDSDLDVSDPLDMARMMGRMRARLAGKTAAKPEAPKITPTNAPEPPQGRARGGTGRFEVDATTSDFAAFERKVNGAR